MQETRATPETRETMVSVVMVAQQETQETPATQETPETMVREEIEATVVTQAMQATPEIPAVLAAPVVVAVLAFQSSLRTTALALPGTLLAALMEAMEALAQLTAMSPVRATGTREMRVITARLETMATTAMDAAGETTETPVVQELTATPEM